MQVADLFASLGLKVDSASFTEANQALEVVSKAIEAVKFAWKQSFGRFEHVSEAISESERLAAQFGVTSSELEGMKVAADLADISFEFLQNSMTHLAVASNAAAQGGAEALESLSGIQLKDANGQLKNASDLMLDVADKMEGMTDQTEKVALAVKVFGRGGASMVPFLQQGSKAIKVAIEETKKYGTAISKAQKDAAGAFDRSTKTMGYAQAALNNTFANPEGFNALARIQMMLADLAINPVIKYAVEKLGKAFTWLALQVEKVIKPFKEFLDDPENQKIVIQTLDAAVTSFALVALPLLTKAWVSAGIAAMAAIAPMLPVILAVVAGVTLLVLVVDDVLTGLKGGESYFGDFLKWLNQPADEGGLLGALHYLLLQIKDLIVWISQLTLDDFKAALQWISKWTGFDLMLNVVGKVIDAVRILVGLISKIPGMGDIVGKVGEVAKTVSGVGMLEGAVDNFSAFGNQIQNAERAKRAWQYSPTPAPPVEYGAWGATPPPGMGGPITMAPVITVNVQNTNASPDEIAAKFAEAQDKANAEMLRTMQGQR